LVVAAGCGTDPLSNGGFEIDCGGHPCDWIVTEGQASFGSGWHDGDPAIDLSGAGRAVVEQRAAPLHLLERELLLEAAIACGPGVSLRFELNWYAQGSAAGATFWATQPQLIDSRPLTVDQTGVFQFKKLTASPSLEAQGLVFRIVKEGAGQALVDEIHLRPYYDQQGGY